MFCQPTRTDRAEIHELPRFAAEEINEAHGGKRHAREEDHRENHLLSMAARGLNNLGGIEGASKKRGIAR
jgi:hypothetical protein